MLLTTKHAKSLAIAPPFWEHLGASVIEYVVDTDLLGTFSGEKEREGSALDCARRKCEWSLKRLGTKAEFALASEGSFGPHPDIPFLPCDREILYFIDQRRGFHLHLSEVTERTNYRMQTATSWPDMLGLVDQVQFPSHGLILCPNHKDLSKPIFKGIDCLDDLEAAFETCMALSRDGGVWVETDMRADHNPTRMDVIGTLAAKMARRLATLCPNCTAPGWGSLRVEKGLSCQQCGMPTNMVKSEIFGCVLCPFEEKLARRDGLQYAEPSMCAFCNP